MALAPSLRTRRRSRRCSHRCSVRSTVRLTTRSVVRRRWRAPDDLGAALTALRRAIRAHRRLARLAPRFFDSGVIERERRECEERRRWMALWEPALARTYGPEHQPAPPPDDRPPLPPPSTQRAVQRALDDWALWLYTGRVAMARHKQRHPHALPSWSRLARLLAIAMDFRQLACGSESDSAGPGAVDYGAIRAQAWADLERTVGHLRQPASAGPGGGPVPLQRGATGAPAPAPVPFMPAPCGESPLPACDHASPAPAPAPAVPGPALATAACRRDAWSSWARQLHRRAHPPGTS